MSGQYYGDVTESGRVLYCNICGEQLIEKKTSNCIDGAYDSHTGKRLVKYVCPSGKCEHMGHEHKRTPWGFFRKPSACLKCGDPYVDMGTD